MTPTAALEARRPAVIHDPSLGGRFVADRAVLDEGWLHASGRVRRAQAGDLPDLEGPPQERSWSSALPVRIEWGAGR